MPTLRQMTADNIGEHLRETFVVRRPNSHLDSLALEALWPPGKFIRAKLSAVACLSLGGTLEQALEVAASIETLHGATLVHDDIIDHGSVRRGRPTLVANYGADAALLAGDLMIFESIVTLAGSGMEPARARVAMRMLGHCGRLLCQGEHGDLVLLTTPAARVSDYLHVALGKTASLIATSCALGALAAEGSWDSVQALYTYGQHLGIAYQVQDDLLPYGTEGPMPDKDPLRDLLERKATLPAIIAYRMLDVSARGRLLSYYEHRDGAENSIEVATAMRDLIASTGAPKVSHEIARLIASWGNAALANLPASQHKVWLMSMCSRIIE